jgi:hypothetical protein
LKPPGEKSFTGIVVDFQYVHYYGGRCCEQRKWRIRCSPIKAADKYAVIWAYYMPYSVSLLG